MLLTILWDFPNHIPIAGFELRYYSLMFIISFVLGHYGMQYVFKRENVNPKLMDSLIYWMVGATIVGARLGHVIFYDWSYYKDHLEEILMVWKGGLASHGAAIAIVAAMFYWSKKLAKKHPLWTLDRIVIVVALAAGFIRMGNWFNSEIYGAPANNTFETVFAEHGRNTLIRGYGGTLKSVSFEATDEFVRTDSITYPVLNTTLSFARLNDVQTEQYTTDFLPRILNMQNSDNQNLLVQGVPEVTVYEDENGWHAQTQVLGVPRYPTQLFEAAGYWLFFIILVLLYLKTSVGEKRGFLFGLFLVLVFGFRFFIENFKEVQVDFEQGMQLNMGQWLSIPLVAIGLLFIALSKRNKSSL